MFTTHTSTSSPIKPLLLYASIKIIKYMCKLYVFSNIKLSMYSHIFHFNIFFNIYTSINQKNKFIHDTWVNLNHISDVFNKIYTSGMNMWYILYSYQNERNKYLHLITKNTSHKTWKILLFLKRFELPVYEILIKVFFIQMVKLRN